MDQTSDDTLQTVSTDQRQPPPLSVKGRTRLFLTPTEPIIRQQEQQEAQLLLQTKTTTSTQNAELQDRSSAVAVPSTINNDPMEVCVCVLLFFFGTEVTN